MPVKGYYLALTLDKHKDFPFTIHGLWPQYDAHHWPEYCEPQPFVLERLAPILPRLHEEWHSLRGPDTLFWEDEWLKHGTCTGMSEIEYFTRALECYEKAKAKGGHWISTHFTGHTHNIPIDLNWNIGHLFF